jgi:chemotaxis protein methyltransferase CheR
LNAFATQSETQSIEGIEIKLLLEAISLRYGYDFREYAVGPLRRSISAGMAAEGVPTMSAYQDRLLRDASCMQRESLIFAPASSRYQQVQGGVSVFRKVQ